MKKLLRIVMPIIVLLIALAFIAPSFISADMLKGKLIAQVKAATGRTLTIGGDVKLTFFPVAGVTASDVSLSGISKDRPLVALKSLEMNVEVMPLFSKQLVVKALHLDNPQINLDVAENGKQSWFFDAHQPETAAASQAKSSGGASLQNIALADVKITNGVVNYHNAQTGDKWNVSALDVKVSMESLSKPLTFKGSANMQGKEVAISGDMTCVQKNCQFANASFGYDKLKASGVIAVDYGKTVPFVSVKLKTDELDLTPFMPAQPQKKAAVFELVSEALAAEGWSRAPIDFAPLRKMNIDALVEAKKIIANKLHVENATLKAKLNNGKLQADVTDADLYGGKGSIAVELDSISANLKKSMSIRGVKAEPFLIDAMSEEHLSGTADMDMTVAGRGRSEYEIVNSLNGNGTVKFSDGAIKGINIADMVRNVQSAFKNVDSGSQKTDFAELGGTFTITSGIVKNSDLYMKAPLLRLSGAGQADLPNRTVNYRLKPEIVQTIQGQGGKEKEGLGVPIVISGTFDHLSWQPDLQGVITDAINNPEKAKQAVKDIKQQFNKENRKETLKNLKDLLR